jgi:diadenosine tetraphosphate (Ap4A) HIT family hydrolase
MNNKYDKQNIFAQIIGGKIPCDKVFETKFSLAFNDINPKAPIHVLVIPKNEYVNVNDFSQNASKDEIADIFYVIYKVVEKLGIKDSGYRLLSNNGEDANQEVPHLHFHIIGGIARK